MCYTDCTNIAKAEVRAAPPLKRHRPLQIRESRHVLQEEDGRCRACDRFVANPRAFLCEDCISGPTPDADIAFCVKMFGLAEEQTGVLREAARGHNIFFTGAAGTGKSTTLRALVRYLHRKRVHTEVVSPTGIAALNVGGRTMHTFAGWTTKAVKLPLQRLERIACGKKNWKRLSWPRVLIIDEISMVSNFMLSRLDHIMRAARKIDRPFGGVLLCVTGDFHQLPPVKYVSTAHPQGLD